MRRRLVVLVEEAVVSSLSLFKGLDRHVVVLEDYFLEDLVQHLFL